MNINAYQLVKQVRTRVAAAVMTAMLVMATSVSSFASSSGGYTTHRDRVYAYSTDTYTQVFRGGETARVGVKGDGDTELDLYIYDEYGNPVAEDEDGDRVCLVSWTPSRTSRFTIKVVNRGNVYNDYVIATN